MPIPRLAIGTPAEVTHPDALKAALAEFFSTFIFVFAGRGSLIAFGMQFIPRHIPNAHHPFANVPYRRPQRS